MLDGPFIVACNSLEKKKKTSKEGLWFVFPVMYGKSERPQKSFGCEFSLAEFCTCTGQIRNSNFKKSLPKRDYVLNTLWSILYSSSLYNYLAYISEQNSKGSTLHKVPVILLTCFILFMLLFLFYMAHA